MPCPAQMLGNAITIHLDRTPAPDCFRRGTIYRARRKCLATPLPFTSISRQNALVRGDGASLSAIGATEASPARQSWETRPSNPERRRCDTFRVTARSSLRRVLHGFEGTTDDRAVICSRVRLGLPPTRRRRQVVRQTSAIPSSAVRSRPAPPASLNPLQPKRVPTQTL